ncbi:MAG TPA: hypothetical protein VG032_02395 [Acidimicrobiales bacterium]|nr:hypothetical protein [Acidimicrobiales bacterium]
MSTRERISDSREQARQAVAEQVAEWSPDRGVDVGDSHDKGEPSLCVGEAA